MEKLNNLQEDLYEVKNLMLGIPIPVSADEVKDMLDSHKNSCIALNESIEDNLEKLNKMAKELKGVIAMSRATLKSCSKS